MQTIEEKRAYYRKYYHEKRDKKARVEYDRKRRLEIVKIIQKIKLDNWCKICWYNKSPFSLHFDHRDRKTKTNNIGTMVWNWNWLKIIMKEIDKCDILCANCHWEKTNKEIEIEMGLH